ncbi:MAG TPA: hypothetical protein VIH42_13075 [Thermoguttaceae bacterium]
MNRFFIIFIIACSLAGCKSQTPVVDPFFGRTTIPPPPTGSIPGQPVDPYYKSPAPLQPTPSYSPGITPPNQLQSVPQNNPGFYSPPANISVPTPTSPPSSMPSSPAPSTWPGGNRYTPPGGNFNYRGTSTQPPNVYGTTASSTRVPTPYFAGGVPNRTSVPITDNSPRPIDDTVENVPRPNQNVSNSAPVFAPAGNPAGSNISLTGRSPILRTLEPQPNSQNNGYSYPAPRRSSEPTPVQPPNNNSSKPAWRESTSFETPAGDNAVEAVSGTESEDE